MNRREFIFGSTACMLFPCFGKTSNNEFSNKIKPNYYTIVHEIIECSKDIVYFAEKYIKLPYGKKLVLKDWQKKYLKHLASKQDAVLCAYRQSGKTTLDMIYSIWLTNFYPNQKVTFVTCNKNNENCISKIVNDMFDNLPIWLNSKSKNTYIYRKNNICTSSQSSIVIASADSNFRGYFPGKVLIIDEFAYYSDEGTKNAIDLIPIASSYNGQLIIASTLNKNNDIFSNMISNLRNTNDNKLFTILAI